MVEITAIPETNGIPIVTILEERFKGKKVYLDNDSNAAALGEYYFGVARNVDNSPVHCTVGCTGINAAGCACTALVRC